jgi:two-component system nitrogen regulation response regulator NtrX
MVILDVWLQGSELDGLQLLDVIRREEPPIPVVMISGHGTIDTAVSAIKSGAYDFIEKPFKADRLLLVVDRAIEADRLKRENASLRRRAGGEVFFVGSSGPATSVRGQIERVAPTGSRVLIAGPSGAGKETVARLIHQGSKRADGPFVVINCSTLPAERLELELFGTDGETEGDSLHLSGALELAHGGTLVFKEVGDLPVALQSRLRRACCRNSRTPATPARPASRSMRPSTASTARTLQDEIAAGSFREELFHRLNVVSLRVPPLSERREDIPELATDLLRRVADATGPPTRLIGDDTLALQGQRLAGQCPPAAQRHRAVIDPGAGRRRADPPTCCSKRCQRGCTIGSALGEGGRDHATAAARRARGLRREYLLAQVTRFGGNIRAPRPSSAWERRRRIAS